MHTQQQLKQISDIIKTLSRIDYPDAERTAKEIVEEYNFDQNQINDVLERLTDGEPWEYIRGYALFKDEKFIVDKHVLIPRIETEQLVDIALALIQKLDIKEVIDVGTGSGAIVCSIAKENKNIKAIATDISKEALKRAEVNAKKLKLKISFIETNLIEEIKIDSPTLITANLPYITTDEYGRLPDSVRSFEPKVALEGGKDGGELIRELLIQLKPYENSVKAIVLEMDPAMTESIKLHIEKMLPFYRAEIVKDFRDQKRFVVATLPPLK